MHSTDKYAQHSSIIWPVWLNGWMFVYELSGCVLESHCRKLIKSKISYEDFTTIINEEKTIMNLKKPLEWWKLKEVILKKNFWLKKVKENTFIKLLDKIR